MNMDFLQSHLSDKKQLAGQINLHPYKLEAASYIQNVFFANKYLKSNR